MHPILIPSAGSPITVHDVVQIESTIAQQVATITDLSTLDEMRAKADALARYLAGKELHGPMLGAPRRIEARIGQLLGEAPGHGPGRGEKMPREQSFISGADRVRFRQLARGFEVLTDEQWRQSRRAVLALLQERFPTPRSDGTASTQCHSSVTPDPPPAENTTEPNGAAADSDVHETGDPERPDMTALDAEAAESFERERQSQIDRWLQADDKLAALQTQNEQLVHRIAGLNVSLAGEMNKASAAISAVKAAQRQIDAVERKNSRLQREIDRLRAELIDLRGAKRAAAATAPKPCPRCDGEGCEWCRP
jgi:cell division protein FtsB